MHVRLATLDDIDQITRNILHRAQEFMAIEQEPLHITDRETYKGVSEALKNKKRGFYIVVEKNNTLIGQVFITSEWSDWRNQEIWWLHRVYIQKKYRGKGIMKKLYKEIEKMAQKQNVFALRLYLHTNNKNAIKIYTKIGLEKSSFEIYTQKMNQRL